MNNQDKIWGKIESNEKSIMNLEKKMLAKKMMNLPIMKRKKKQSEKNAGDGGGTMRLF